MPHIALTALTILLTMFGASAWADDFRRISTKADFITSITERPLSAGLGRVMIHADGTASGKAGLIKISGVWHWQGGFFCRYMVVAGNKTKSDCQVVQLSADDKTLRFIAKQGTGKVKTYSIQ